MESDRRSQSVWIREGDEEDLVDLLGRKSIIDKITTTQPKPAKAASQSTAVGTATKMPANGAGKPKEVGEVVTHERLTAKKEKLDRKHKL